MDVEYCRICRGEATPDQPLFYPCKCRGSIKYIHQSCLETWLKHTQSNRCDICHSEIKFTTIYDENTPEHIPVTLVIKKAQKLVGYTLQFVAKVIVGSLVLFELPLFWHIVVSMYSWLLDGKMPKESLLDSLIYGEDEIPSMVSWEYLFTRLLNNASWGLVQILLTVGTMVLFYINYFFVSKEPVFSKMALQKIGRDHHEILRENFVNRPQIPLEDLQQLREIVIGMEAGRAFRNQEFPENDEEDLDFVPETESEDETDGDLEIEEQEREEHEEEDEEEEDLLHEHFQEQLRRQLFNQREHLQGELFNRLQQHHEPADLDPPNIGHLHDLPPLPGMRNIDPPLPAEPADVNDGEEPRGDFEFDREDDNIMIRMRFSISSLLKVAVIGSIVMLTALFVLYCVPGFLGKIPVFAVNMILRAGCRLVTMCGYQVPTVQLPEWKIISLGCFYAIVVYAIVWSTKYISRNSGIHRPLVGNLRSIFKVLFAARYTLKVFVMFAMELAVFPVYAGTLLDFSFAPLFSSTHWLIMPTISRYTLGTLVLYWLVGTTYMYTFASYVGMLRRYILRPGVLFFIRSPDDPNTKLVHDALLQPFRIQFNRLLLSASIYTVFIVVGFSHTRTLQPKQMNSSWQQIFLVLPLIPMMNRAISSNYNVLALYVRQYWQIAFSVSCKKLRMSSFVLGNYEPTEGGRIVYRNIFYQLFSRPEPDYSNPKSASDARNAFKEDRAVHSYYVPDGNLIRAPKHDGISRQYIQQMFVPVTKNDQLLKPLQLRPRPKGEFDDLDTQFVDNDAYEIVYCPPNFRARYMSLIVMIWIFASILIISSLLLANTFGKPLTYVTSLILNFFNLPQYVGTDLNLTVLDLDALVLGMIMLIYGLSYYHKNKISKYLHVVHDDDDNAEDEDLQEEPQIIEEPVFNDPRDGDIWMPYLLGMVHLLYGISFYTHNQLAVVVPDIKWPMVWKTILMLYCIKELTSLHTEIYQQDGDKKEILKKYYKDWFKEFFIILLPTILFKLCVSLWVYKQQDQLDLVTCIFYVVSMQDPRTAYYIKMSYPYWSFVVFGCIIVSKAFKYYKLVSQLAKEEVYGRGQSLQNSTE